MSTAEILKNLRLEKGLTQKELAKKLNIGQSTIVGYEKKISEPVSESIRAYCRFFGVSADYILGIEDELGNKEYSSNFLKFNLEDMQLLRKLHSLNIYSQNAFKIQIDAMYEKEKELEKNKND